VDAGFGTQRTVGVIAGQLDRRALDAGDVAFGFFHDFHGEPLLFAEFQVHAQQHRGPVLSFGTASAGLDFEEAVRGVGRVVEHPAEFEGGNLLLDLGAVGLDRVQRIVVVFLAAHLEQLAAVLDPGINRFKDEDDVFQRFFLAAHFLGAFRLIPNLGIFHFLRQQGQAFALVIVVKDTSVARRRAAPGRRAGWRWH